MKNRKFVVVAFMLVAVLVLGVGYAAVSNVLDIQGSVTVSGESVNEEFKSDIYFAGVVKEGVLVDKVTTEDALGYTANINSNNNDKAQFTVTGITATGEFETITFRIYNESDYEASVALKTITNSNNSEEGGDFGFIYYFGTEDKKTATIAAGGEVDVTVKISLDEQLKAETTANFGIELNVSAE